MREILFKAKRADNGEWVEGYPLPSIAGKELNRMTVFEPFPGGTSVNTYNVDPETVCQYTGKKICQKQVTGEIASEPRKVWCDDLIAIYTIYYDDNDNPIGDRIAIVHVAFDEEYQIPYAKCVYGTMEEVVNECAIQYMDGSEDWPFTFWIEYMENSRNQFWEWEIIGNIYDKEE